MNDSAVPTLRNLESWNPEGFARALTRAAFTQKGLEHHRLDGVAYQGRAAALFRESLPPGTALKTLGRLFMLGDTLPLDEVLAALGMETGALAEIGFLIPRDGGARSGFSLVPYGDGWHASDFLNVHSENPAEFVMGLGPTTRMLAALLPKSGAETVLDLGCGGGWLAMRMCRAGMAATGCDISPRAIRLAEFNARLAGTSPVEWHVGSWFEPVRGRRFDRICSNPPYVQSPGGALTFRETAPGDTPPCQRILGEVADHLNPDGIACILMNWSHRDAGDWRDQPLAWTPQAGVRRWLFQTELLWPVEYAWRWLNHDSRFADPDAARAELDRWLAHYAEAGVGAISSGFMVIQRCEAGGEWTRTDSRDTGYPPPHAGEEVMRVLENETWLQRGHTDENLLNRHYHVPDGMRAEILTGLDDDGWRRQGIRLGSPARLSYDGQVDENLLRLLELCRAGRRPADMVAELEQNPAFADLPDPGARIAGLTRELLHHALILPA